MRALLGVFFLAACAGHPEPAGPPNPLRGYDIVIRGRDSLSQALGQALARAGYVVRDDVRGGGGKAAALVVFRFVDAEGRANLEAQLADTRRGTVLGSATIPADTLATDLSGRADLLLRGLLTSIP